VRASQPDTNSTLGNLDEYRLQGPFKVPESPVGVVVDVTDPDIVSTL
jgi:hypothetical protein